MYILNHKPLNAIQFSSERLYSIFFFVGSSRLSHGSNILNNEDAWIFTQPLRMPNLQTTLGSSQIQKYVNLKITDLKSIIETFS